MKELLVLLTIQSLFFTSCVDSTSGKRRAIASLDQIDSEVGLGGSDGKGAVPVPGGGIGGGGGTVSEPRLELTHIVDPFDGSYKSKVTIPRNFTGLLYIAGLNLAPLRDKFFKVRFNFGADYAPVTFEKPYLGRPGTGITPQTNTDVIILNMAGTPFLNVRLFYNLFDYNDYRVAGVETKTPTSDPRNSGLYCRGLDIKYDPTFETSVANSSCDAAGEKCFYTYAKIEDVNLYDATGTTPTLPTERQIDLSGSGYSQDSFTTNQTKCLPDTVDIPAFNTVMGITPLGAGVISYGTLVTNLADTFMYKGPYRTLNNDLWQVTGDAVFSKVDATTEATGIFQTSFFDGANPKVGYESLMFPRAGIFENQRSGVEYVHLNSDLSDSTRALNSLLSDGDSELVDGCNLRKAFVNEDAQVKEDISSCNVTATIEIITKDENGVEEILTTSSELKLQLIKPSLTDFRGEEVLYSALKTCTNSRSCGGGECCYNNRCWEKAIVGQCLEDVPSVGNGGISDTCKSDYECSSFCCGSTGVCSEHINTEVDKVLCSKSPGQSCVAKEFCRLENVRDCRIIKTGFDAQGSVTCSLICYNVPTFGNCLNSKCSPPSPIPIPVFDPDNPDCTNAGNPPIID